MAGKIYEAPPPPPQTPVPSTNDETQAFLRAWTDYQFRLNNYLEQLTKFLSENYAGAKDTSSDVNHTHP